MSSLPRLTLLVPALCGLLLACDDDDAPSPEPGDGGQQDAGPRPDSGTGGSIDAGTTPLDAATSTPDATVDASQPTPSAFSLDFAAVSGGKVVGCGDTLSGLGANGMSTASINDLRLYISALEFFDASGKAVPLTLDANLFQLLDPAGDVSLIDLTSDQVGACNPDNFAESEGTGRTHTAITGTTLVNQVASVKFKVGIPQALMKKVIANNTQEGAPSPLAEMSWTWAGGYRFFVWNLTVNKDGDSAQPGIGYVHVGSTGCSASFEVNALSDRDECARINTPAVSLPSFSLTTQKVTIDLDAIVEKLDFMAETYDSMFQVNGSAPGVACHSGETAADCTDIFAAFGLTFSTGLADASKNIVFKAGSK